MRLLDTRSLSLVYFNGEPPPYATLSHRWTDHEVSLLDLATGGESLASAGYQKLANSARVALGAGFDYIWMDTCCIDKSSSAELSEAINSMFQWYRASGLAIVYLADVRGGAPLTSSSWFTRGWTLQELIAPAEVIFYDASWEPVGTKLTLANEISAATGVSIDVLRGADLDLIPACRKMSWASGRVTTRGEDMAYSLMGLFNVNMPLLYGEGAERAFRRLQEAFIRESDDESIFAWTVDASQAAEKPYWGLLAASPAFFKHSSSYTIPQLKSWRQGGPTDITNRGLRVSLTLQPLRGDPSNTLFLAPLNCALGLDGDDRPFNILLQKLSDFEDQYTRVAPHDANPIEEGQNPLLASKQSEHHESDEVELYVRSQPKTSDAVAGFCVNMAQSVLFDFPTNSPNGPIVLQGTSYARFEPEPAWHERPTAPLQQVCFLELTKRAGAWAFDPDTYHVQDLVQRRIMGSIPISFVSKIEEQGPRPQTYQMQQTVPNPILIVGFEPLPTNKLGTPPGFIRPWYSFSQATGKAAEDKLLYSAANQQPVYVAPGHCPVKVNFRPVSHHFRTFYEISLVPAKATM